MFFGLTALTVVAIQTLRNSKDMISLAYVSVGSTITLNYVFTPQMILMISPITVLALNKKELKKYVIADTANFFLIIAFFEDSTLRSIISKIIPIRTGFNPWTIDSPTQWLAMVRNVLILVTIVELMIKRKRRIEVT
ncbi:MAG: hypothetical protein ACK416_01800 [Zestosphaera sp.]